MRLVLLVSFLIAAIPGWLIAPLFDHDQVLGVVGVLLLITIVLGWVQAFLHSGVRVHQSPLGPTLWTVWSRWATPLRQNPALVLMAMSAGLLAGVIGRVLFLVRP